MLTRLLGAALVIGGCGAAGLSRSCALRRRVKQLDRLRIQMEQVRMEICRLQTPLPGVLNILTGWSAAEEIREQPFSAIWEREIAGLTLAPPEKQLLIGLCPALSRGEEPERVFDAAEVRLAALHRQAAEEAEKNCRLYSGLGLCGGVMLAIVLI